jgi:hypothetical protein
MKKILVVAACTLIFLQSCKKEKNTPPDFAAALKKTEWFGQLKNKNEPFTRGYAIALYGDGGFTFFTASTTFPGKWTVTGNKINLKFDVGALNEWTGEISSDTLITFNTPYPNNFSFEGTAKKITGIAPDNYIGHVWKGTDLPPSQLILETAWLTLDGTFGYYFLPSFSNKIFRTSTTTSDILVVIDGQVATVFYLHKEADIQTVRKYKY